MRSRDGNKRKRRRVAVNKRVDRISNLPGDVIDQILGFMTTRDAARTSILSSKWRYAWAQHPQLILDKQFWEAISQSCKDARQQDRSDFMLFECKCAFAVDRIVLQHRGPISKLVLDIPLLSLAFSSHIEKRMQFLLSRGGIRELTLDFSRNPPTYRSGYCCMPPSIFSSCPQLSYLNLPRCVWSNGFQGFNNLSRMFISRTTFPSPLVLNMPQLLVLSLRTCRYIRHFKPCAPSLEELILDDNNSIDCFSCYITCKNLASVRIERPNAVIRCSPPKNERFTLTELLRSWPKLRKLCLDGPAIKCLAADEVPYGLSTELSCSLTHFKASTLSYTLKEITFILCLLRSAFKLSEFEIGRYHGGVEDDKKVEDYLKEPGLIMQSMKGLQTVIIKYFGSSTAEALLAELLLANSPSLERMHIEVSSRDPLKSLKTSEKLMRCSRASPEAKITFIKTSSVGTSCKTFIVELRYTTKGYFIPFAWLVSSLYYLWANRHLILALFLFSFFFSFFGS